ncbi:MAG: hypothetical protein WC353_04300 [Candidatus Peribacter sp.]|jgi:hypothetical protein
MTPESATPSAVNSNLWQRLRTKIVIAALLLCLLYSAFVLVQEWKSDGKTHALTHGAPILRALLFQRGTQMDLYDPHGQFVRSVQEPKRTEELPIARLLSTRAILVAAGTQARVRDMGSSYAYDALPSGSQSSLVSLSRNTNFTYFIPEGPDRTHLHIDFAGCGEIAAMKLPAAELWYDPDQLFSTLALPIQQKMMLSPAETSLALVNQTMFPRITLVHLIERQASALSVPSFDPDQLHFSPFYIDDQTLLFSVLDRKHWGTVRYHLSTGTYEMLSTDFTDHAYVSRSGDVILQQSFFGETINIPFGSVALLDRQKSIPAREIESIIGPRENHAGLFSLLFSNPEASALHFRSDLTTASFNGIAQSELRESLRTYWREYQLKLLHAVGTFRLLKLAPDGTLTHVETLPFEIHPPATFAQYMDDAEPLLRALELPPSLIEEYRKRRADAVEQRDYYILVDSLGY